MSTLTDRLDACIPHTPHCGDACYCGSARRKLAEAQTAVVAEWLTSDDGARAAVSTLPHLHLVGGIHEMPCEKVHCTEPADALARVTALAAEAVKGAGQ